MVDQVAQIITRLPAQASVEVLDFARFLTLRREQEQAFAATSVVGEL